MFAASATKINACFSHQDKDGTEALQVKSSIKIRNNSYKNVIAIDGFESGEL
jgi:hypothetical protein